MPVPEEPVIFFKATTAIGGPYDDVILPRGSQKTDWEVELGVVIGERASYVSHDDAMNCVAGYCIVNDLSERAFQLERGGQWVKGKSCRICGRTYMSAPRGRIEVVCDTNFRQFTPL
jgi:2,4-diketo-3-deoxy-L-fuconate hydrolase